MVQLSTLVFSTVGLVAIATPVAAGPIISVVAGVGGAVLDQLTSRSLDADDSNIFRQCALQMADPEVPSVQWTQVNSNQVSLTRVPPECQDAIEAYVSDPDNKDKEGKQGTAKVIDPKKGKVLCSELPKDIMDLLVKPDKPE